MRPRIVYRTHYQVDEPALLSFVVRHCTSAAQSTYSERVATRLSRYLLTRGRRLNLSAAGYAVDLAQSLGVLSENNSWTDKGHLVALIANADSTDLEPNFALTANQQFLYFRLFLEADGALMLFLARAALASAVIPLPNAGWNQLAQQMFVETLTGYLRTVAETRDRVRLRADIGRIVRRPFRGRTGEHKAFVHLQTMYRLGLLHRSPKSSARIYTTDGCVPRLQALCRAIPDISALEQCVRGTGWVSIADSVFRSPGVPRPVMAEADAIHLLLRFYSEVAATGAPLCSISTLTDALSIALLERGFEVQTRGGALAVLSALQKANPREVRFHVDRRGCPAFVKISSRLLSAAI